MDKNKKNKLIMLTISTLAILIIVVGVSYAFFRFSLSSANQELVAGQIYMHYKEGQKQINISEAVPSSTYDENEYFEFTIDGKNTSNKDIWYAITLSYGDAPSDRDTKIEDKFLKFTLFEGTSKVVDGASYKNLNNKKLWVNKIDKNTTEDVNITYKLYMWISDKVNIGDDGDYTINDWNNKVYASVKVNVVGDFTEKTIDKPDGSGPIMEGTLAGLAKDIFDKAYTNEQELIAIDKEGNKCESLSGCEVRELRYIGPSVNNYIYLKDNNGYNEKWRIIGLFQNDEGTEWNVKIVRNEVLPEGHLPKTYVINDASINGSTQKVTYTIHGSSYSAYWDYKDSETKNNRWEESGLQYYLNTEHDDSSSPVKGYLSYLSAETKALLAEKKTYYLGTFHASNLVDTPKQAYTHERDVESCEGGKGPSSNNNQSAVERENSGCNVWSGNASTWTGQVALMYPSDYGLSASEVNWTTPMFDSNGTSFKDAAVNSTTWMYSTMTDSKGKGSWFLSPASTGSSNVALWITEGNMTNNFVPNGAGVRPVLYLSSSATKLAGDGTFNNPYRILKKEEKLEGLAKTIVDKAYSNDNEMIAIDLTDKSNIKKCESVEACKGKEIEYRYSGPTVNNYVYLKSDTGINEKWRIIGVFYNDITESWNVKAVRDEVLPESYLPDTYVIYSAVINGTRKNVTYTIQATNSSTSDKYRAYWNRNDSGTQLNRWEESGLQYYLNTEKDDRGSKKGYLSFLSPETKALLVNNTYYLGTVHTYSQPYDTPKEAYNHERDVASCAGGKGTSSNSSRSAIESESSGCHVWSGNMATYENSKVSLMYLSDYGLSASETNWTKLLYANSATGFEDADVNATTWMYSTMSDPKTKYSWFLSPSSNGSGSASGWNASGYVYGSSVNSNNYGVRPVLFLSSQATVKNGSGTGTSSSPYVILD